jgi:nicotinamidase-related amidase
MGIPFVRLAVVRYPAEAHCKNKEHCPQQYYCSHDSLKTKHSAAIAIIRNSSISSKEYFLPFTTLDPQSALIVVDLQKGLRNIPSIHPLLGVIDRSCQLIQAFRKQKLPVVLVNVAGTAAGRTEEPRWQREIPADFSDLIPELDQQQDDILITKRTWGAFANTDLEAQLKARSVTQVVLVGVATATGVEATARQAYEAGFNVMLVTDAMTDTRAEAHEYSLKHVFPRLGETCSSQDILLLLEKRC